MPTLTSASPAAVPKNGGYLIEVVGTFARENAHRLYLGPAGDATDPQTFQPGKAGLVFALTTTRMQVYTPIQAAGGPYDLFVEDQVTLETASLSGAITFLEIPYYTSVFDIRQVMPIRMRTGPRQLDQLPAIGA